MQKKSSVDIAERKLEFPIVTSYNCIKVLIDHQYGVKCLLELHNSNIASGSYDTTIKIWNGKTYQCITTLHGHTQVVMCLIQLTNDDLVSAAGDLIKIWNVIHLNCKATLMGHTNTIYVMIQIDHTTIASGGVDKTIKLWDTLTYRHKARLPENDEWVRTLITFNSAFIVSGSNAFIHIWDINTFGYQRKLVIHSKPVSGLVEINNETLASCSFDGLIIIWDMVSFTAQAQIDGPHKSSITCIALMNEQYLLTGDDDNVIHVFDINSRKCVETINQHSKTITALIKIANASTIANDKLIIVSCSLDGTISIWSFENVIQQKKI